MKENKRIPVGPLTQSITGILHLPPDWDYREELTNILMEKYGITDEELQRLPKWSADDLQAEIAKINQQNK